MKKNCLQKSVKENIDTQYYHWMWNSMACWKGDPKIVSKELKKLKSKSVKSHAVKENIMIWVKGFGWDWCKHAWAKDGRKYTVFELAKHLQMIIKKEKQLGIPSKPPINMPQQMDLPVLGTLTSMASLDESTMQMNQMSMQRLKRCILNENQKAKEVCIPNCSHLVGLILKI